MLALLLAVLAAALVLGLTLGSVSVPVGDVLRALVGGADEQTRLLIVGIRLPRLTLALLVGGGLAMAGAVFQALLRNPLADPYILGVSGGAAVGAVATMVLGLALGQGGVTLGAIVGAAAAIFLVLRIALAVGPALDTRVLLLAGVVVGAFFNAVILLMLTTADADSFRSAVFWMMGSLGRAGWSDLARSALFLAPCVVIILAMARPLNLLSVGEETANYLGVPVEGVKRVAYLTASLAVAATVSVVGIIGFVGLIVPHAIRMLWGSDHRLLLPASFLAGGTFLILTDAVARTVVAAQEMPTGVITALIGVPLFAVLLVRSHR